MDLRAQADYDTGEVHVSRRRHDEGECIGDTGVTRRGRADHEADLGELERAADRLLTEIGLKRTGPWRRGRDWKIATTVTEAEPVPTTS
ncbi:hypothetical protein I6A84_01420 [Frankia sp. CNm7]|uniref:Uncharacterized protein n=1 Tax=Frankia nepalensis TaxID=1836974 RepID=A0A937RCB4_9ACTN|nr:hypothetical protein [Frankia nepalensis]MBL7497997.1 hypothetical protein [Frankia nepalensis]MBL7509079.1 hypothetical protein [Frankia nepalensis]MBL7516818.1 hypothetical protein [Frankia nepalensis]MBL7627815.1 hypothetical protein [Frankia nepalensis]